jgi:hypothetical protein
VDLVAFYGLIGNLLMFALGGEIKEKILMPENQF